MLSDEKELDKFVEAVKGSKDEMVALGRQKICHAVVNLILI